MRLAGLLVFAMAMLAAAPAQAAISDCKAVPISEQPGAGGPAMFFMSCAGLNGPPTYSVKTPPAHGTVKDISDEDGSGQHGFLWHVTYWADDDAWGLSDSWVMHVDDGTESADFPVSITIAAAPYCQQLNNGTPSPLPTFRLEAGHLLDQQLICSYGGTDNVTSLSVKQQARHGFAYVQATDGGPSAPRLRYVPNQGFRGTDTFVLALAVGSGSADIPVTVKVTRDRTAPVVKLTKKPRLLKHAVVFRPRCSELCRVRVTLRRGHRRVSVTDTFSGRRAIRVPKPAGHGRLHYTLVARDAAGNRSKVTRGKF
jgi:hypothetical protein